MVRRRDGIPVGVKLKEAVAEEAVHYYAIAEAHADPESGFLGAADELGSVETGEGIVEILNEADGLNVGVGDDGEVAVLREKLDSGRGLEAGRLHETVQEFPIKA